MMKRICSMAIIITMLAALMPLGLFAMTSLPVAVASAAIPAPAFQLPDSEIGTELVSGQWRYALRVEDGFAVIVGYEGSFREGTLPSMLDGHDVVGIASGALPDAE